LPPALRISIPHFAASGCVQDTMPLVLCTTLLLLGHFIRVAEDGRKTDWVLRGILRMFTMIADESILFSR
jgi:hypothetical protein